MVLGGLLLLAGCGEERQQRDSREDAHDVALVQRMNQPPFKPVRPEPFTTDDIASYDLAREGCMFRPGNNPDEAPLFVAQRDRGYVKIEGRLHPLAVRSGSAELPGGAHSTYVGVANWVELIAQAGSQGAAPDGKSAWPSRLVVRDANERVAFNSLGQVSCTVSAAER